MLRIFSFFRDWALAHDLDPAKYRITITPLTVEAEARLKDYWIREVAGRTLSGKAEGDHEFSEGTVFGVPFRIEAAK